ncbi:protein kinase 4-like [Schistocerca americana]|uniref:protein kinase 4-like n=1 Tax=Schistocerca americana TaxID=7009 RepID=UPI001F502D15|nr:protein kinase 4-like [Schistocerca americana]
MLRTTGDVTGHVNERVAMDTADLHVNNMTDATVNITDLDIQSMEVCSVDKVTHPINTASDTLSSGSSSNGLDPETYDSPNTIRKIIYIPNRDQTQTQISSACELQNTQPVTSQPDTTHSAQQLGNVAGNGAFAALLTFLGDRLAQITQKIDESSEKTRYDLTQKMDEMNRDLTRLNQKVEESKRDITQQVRGVKDEVQSLTVQLKRLTVEHNEFKNQLETVLDNSSQNKLITDIGNMKNEVNSIQENYGNIPTEVTKLSDRIGSLELEQKQIKEDLSLVKESLEDTTTAQKVVHEYGTCLTGFERHLAEKETEIVDRVMKQVKTVLEQTKQTSVETNTQTEKPRTVTTDTAISKPPSIEFGNEKSIVRVQDQVQQRYTPQAKDRTSPAVSCLHNMLSSSNYTPHCSCSHSSTPHDGQRQNSNNSNRNGNNRNGNYNHNNNNTPGRQTQQLDYPRGQNGQTYGNKPWNRRENRYNPGYQNGRNRNRGRFQPNSHWQNNNTQNNNRNSNTFGRNRRATYPATGNAWQAQTPSVNIIELNDNNTASTPVLANGSVANTVENSTRHCSPPQR